MSVENLCLNQMIRECAVHCVALQGSMSMAHTRSSYCSLLCSFVVLSLMPLRAYYYHASRKWRVFYFPIGPKFISLLKTKEYFEPTQHEYERPRNPDYVTDVYDTPAWREFMVPPKYPNDKIGFQICVDAIPAFFANTFSLKPFA